MVFASRKAVIVYCTILSGITAASHAGFPVRTVILSAERAPGTATGVSFTEFGVPLLNNAGHTAFTATIAGPGVTAAGDVGLWSEGSGELAQVAREGLEAPGAPAGVTFGGDYSLGNLNNAGSTVFHADLLDPDPSRDPFGSIWLDVPNAGHPVLVEFEGNSLSANSTLESLATYPALNDSGIVTYAAGVEIDIIFTIVYISMIKSGDPLGAGFENVVSGFDAAPGAEPDEFFYAHSPSLNGAGRAAFSASLNSGGYGIWAQDGLGSLKKIALTGDPISTGPLTPKFSLFGPPTFTDPGHVAFIAVLEGTNISSDSDDSIWSHLEPSGLQLIVREGSFAPGTPADSRFGEFGDSWLAINSGGQMAFSAGLVGGGTDASNDSGIWSNASGELVLLAREGDPAPDTSSDVSFGSLQYLYPTINAEGRAAFIAALGGAGVTAGVNDQAIFAEVGAGGGLTLIARTGDTLEVAPGDARTIATLQFTSGGGPSDGLGSAFNDVGQVAFKATFTDGSSGIFVSVVDADSDDVNDVDDNCVQSANSDQADSDGDGMGDVCDTTPESDSDGDGMPDVDDSTEPTPLAGEVCGTCGPGMSGIMATGFALLVMGRRSRQLVSKP